MPIKKSDSNVWVSFIVSLISSPELSAIVKLLSVGALLILTSKYNFSNLLN